MRLRTLRARLLRGVHVNRATPGCAYAARGLAGVRGMRAGARGATCGAGSTRGADIVVSS